MLPVRFSGIMHKEPGATKRQNRMALTVLLFIGTLGLLSTIPVMVTGDWNCFTDKLFSLAGLLA